MINCYRCFLLVLVSTFCMATQAATSPYIEDLTSPEVRDQIAAGASTILIPVGGTEQNGPFMLIGKHNVRVHQLSGQIANKLGKTLVAPVLNYVPEGSINPPAGHMRFAGTISISEAAFESLLESAIRSFKQHGFRHVVLLGDHGGYQTSLEHVAAKLNQEWEHDPACKVQALLEYYRVTQTSYVAALKAKGFSDAEIGTHAGLADTALSLAVDTSLVRTDALAKTAKPTEQQGVYGDPRRATIELGKIGAEQIIESSVTAIRAALRSR